MIALHRTAAAPAGGLLARLLRVVRQALDPARPRGLPRLQPGVAQDAGRIRWFGRIY